MTSFIQDMRFGVRMLAKNSGFTAIAIITLALGIGANTAIFSVVNAVILRPLPYPDPDQLTMIWQSFPRDGTMEDTCSPPNFQDWRQQSQAFEEMSAFRYAAFNLTGDDTPQRLIGARVTPGFFQVMGVQPSIGRAFGREAERADADSKLVVSYLAGGRDASYARSFMSDVADRITTRIQLTSDGHSAYLEAVEDAFGFEVDYSQLIKLYGPETDGNGAERKYSPVRCNGTKKIPQIGLPDKDHVSTSFVERQNLTLRMAQRRFTRLTNAFSKRLVNHEHGIALHHFHYNFIRRHKTIGCTPAVAAGVTDREWTVADLVQMLEDEERKVANGGRINRADRT